MSIGRAASIHARLLNLARERGEDFNLILNLFAMERWLYRLSQSTERDQFCLKGALLFRLWSDVPHRPTRDADFLGLGPADAITLRKAVQMVCRVDADDGMRFEPDSIRIDEIREEAKYGGERVRLIGYLGKARCALQLDIGYGDAVTPAAEMVKYPTLLDDVPPPRLKVYPRQTMFAEKLETIVHFGMINSRMKDYFDLHALVQLGAMDTEVLADAIAATFARRGTMIPEGLPIGLTQEFSRDSTRSDLWAAFLDKSELKAPSLEQVIKTIGAFVGGPLQQARKQVKGR